MFFCILPGTDQQNGDFPCKSGMSGHLKLREIVIVLSGGSHKITFILVATEGHCLSFLMRHKGEIRSLCEAAAHTVSP